MPKNKQPIQISATVETVKAAIGVTWFDCKDEEHHIILETRENGDVAEEQAGAKDVTEAQRLLSVLRRTFNTATWDTKFDVVDEWVAVSVRKEPWAKEEKKRNKRKGQLDKLCSQADCLCNEANKEFQSSRTRAPFGYARYTSGTAYHLILLANFGKRILYRDRPGALFAFDTEDAADKALQPLLTHFPDIKFKKMVSGPTNSYTFNRSPPRNVIEAAGSVQYEASFEGV